MTIVSSERPFFGTQPYDISWSFHCPPNSCVTYDGQLIQYYPVIDNYDLLEGDRRHPKQKIVKGVKDKTTGELSHVDYVVALPRRSLDEFMLWVHRHMDAAQVMSPPELVEKHHQAAIKLLNRYQLP